MPAASPSSARVRRKPGKVSRSPRHRAPEPRPRLSRSGLCWRAHCAQAQTPARPRCAGAVAVSGICQPLPLGLSLPPAPAGARSRRLTRVREFSAPTAPGPPRPQVRGAGQSLRPCRSPLPRLRTRGGLGRGARRLRGGPSRPAGLRRGRGSPFSRVPPRLRAASLRIFAPRVSSDAKMKGSLSPSVTLFANLDRAPLCTVAETAVTPLVRGGDPGACLGISNKMIAHCGRPWTVALVSGS